MDVPDAVEELAERLRQVRWVTDLFVGGSLATRDYRAGVSDLDLVALVDGPVERDRRAELVAIHRELDATVASRADLGCTYVASSALPDLDALHPTWTHRRLVDRALSGIVRAELVRYGFSVLGRSPREVLPAMDDEDVRRAARAELTGYWALAARHPWWFLDPVLADLGPTAMARGRHTLATGELITKTAALDEVHAPVWLQADLRARRRGEPARSPRLRTAWIAWHDVRRTTAAARRTRP